MKSYVTNLQLKLIKPGIKGFIAVLVIFAFSFQGFAAKINPNEAIKLAIKDGTIKEVLKEIENQSAFTFIYNDAYINVNEKISIFCNDRPLNEVLDELLLVRGIKYLFVDNHIVLTNTNLKQEKKTISGKVIDSQTSEPLPGVSILEKGTTNGTITDLDGNFSITISESGIMEIRYVGYKTMEVPVAGYDGSSPLSLEPDVVNLSEIVVIGYGTVKKSDLTGAVASVSADDIRQNIGSGIDQALQGRTAGVSVTTNSGTPGSAPTIRIRGMGTITNPNPFYVVDGIPVSAESISSINPGDIESMEVLKDASSAAIYGARAANGVILITTKKAKTGMSSINFDAYSGMQSVAKKYDIMNGQDWLNIREAAGEDDDPTLVSTDWQDEIFRQAQVNSAQLSFLNGTEKANIALVGSYFNQQGIIRGSDYERYTIRVNSSINLKKWLTLGENVGFSSINQDLIPEQNEWTSVVIQALTIDPVTPVHDSTGTAMGATKNNIGNPVGAIERNYNKLKNQQLLGNVFMEIKPLSWLSFRTSVNTEINRFNNVQFTPIFYESVDNQSTQTTMSAGEYNFTNLMFEQLLTLKKTFVEKHDIQFLVGYSRQSTNYTLGLGQSYDVPDNEDLRKLSNGNNILFEDVAATLIPLSFPYQFSGNPYDNSIISYLGRLIYSFNGKYDITASIRRDGSSNFGSENRWGNFPSFAAGWKVSEESFFPKNDVLNFLKFRFGWGQLGNQEISPYQMYTPVSYGFDYTLGSYGNQVANIGGAPRGFPNQGIKWESTEQTNIGLDANLFRYRLNINFDYFIRNTKDMLAQVPVPGITGIQDSPFVNIGAVSNKGIELNASYRNSEGALKYSFGFNIGAVRNEVTELGSDQPVNSASFRAADFISRTEVGHPIASFYGYVTDGYYQNQAEIDSLNNLARQATGLPVAAFDRGVRPGDIKMKDVNGDSIIDANDRTFIGNPHPKFTYGLNLDLGYKNFDLSVFGQGVYGNDIFMATIYYLESGNGYWNLLNTMNDYWAEEGDNTSVPRLGESAKNMRLSDRYVKNGSYFRIKNITLGYTVPSRISEKIGINKLRVYFSGQNLISFHNYKGFDPEIGTGRNTGNSPSQRGFLDIGIDRGMYPLAKTYSLGVNLTF